MNVAGTCACCGTRALHAQEFILNCFRESGSDVRYRPLGVNSVEATTITRFTLHRAERGAICGDCLRSDWRRRHVPAPFEPWTWLGVGAVLAGGIWARALLGDGDVPIRGFMVSFGGLILGAALCLCMHLRRKMKSAVPPLDWDVQEVDAVARTLLGRMQRLGGCDAVWTRQETARMSLETLLLGWSDPASHGGDKAGPTSR